MDQTPTDMQYKLALAVGSIVAALITGLFTLTSLRISKDKEITDHKKDWINKLQEELSIVLGQIATILILVEKEIPHGPTGLEDAALSRFRRRHAKYYESLNTMYHRIKLRLNNPSHNELVGKLDDLYAAFYGSCDNMDDINKLKNEVKIKAQNILEQEFNEIRKGEPVFQNHTKSIIATTAILIIFLFGIIGYLAIN